MATFRDFIGPTAQVVAIVATVAAAVFWLAKLEARVDRLETFTKTPTVRAAIDEACKAVVDSIRSYAGKPAEYKDTIALLEKQKRDICPPAK